MDTLNKAHLLEKKLKNRTVPYSILALEGALFMKYLLNTFLTQDQIRLS